MSIAGILSRYIHNKRLIRPAEFVIKMALVYIGWRTFKYLGEHNENFLWGGWNWFKNVMAFALTTCTGWLLTAAGYTVAVYDRVIQIQGTRGIYVADLCLGIAPMVIFTAFILAFGDNKRNKIWFIPLGLCLIFITNVARLIALALIQAHSNQYFDLAHDYVYLLLTYGLIFIMLMWWMNKLAFKQKLS